MSFFLENYISPSKSQIKPLHIGFGFGGDVIQQRISLKIKQEKQNLDYSENVNNKIDDNSTISENIIIKNAIVTPNVTASEEIISKSNTVHNLNNIEENNTHEKNTKYYVHPFFAFLAWTVDALLGFCFLIISLCVNYVFIPKGFFEISPAIAKYFSNVTLDINFIYTFLFSLQVWVFMALMVFLFQYTILGFEGSTLGRWLFGISIQNAKDKTVRVSEKTKICAALSESLLLGGILSFIFIVLFPSRVPIFFWMRYSSKNS
ncbi:RDD family protein [Silvanigrella aquatica]|uniref:RDD domain-containing protein n=1 Tax=Silvanigrella aquatica TaxID=1915309 RepID=A0A1L4D1K9_9BACT|nr:RDD family protein [Silvanigrella aquatica]APJ04095.1 hypothetical protein AXG55_09320 [Silvanigrella aquatica]